MLWKTLGGRRIYTSLGGIQIFDNYFFRWLTFGNEIIQTLLYKRKPEKIGLEYLGPLTSAAKIYPGDCCLLGLGGGGAVHALLPYLKDHCIVAVESNKEIIFLAGQYFMLPTHAKLRIIQGDANEFVEKDEQKFLHILVDLFEKREMPLNCFHLQFFENCKKKLKSGGILAVNLANLPDQVKVFNWLRQLFLNSTIVMPIKNCANMVILAGEKNSLDDHISTLKKSKKLKRFFWDSQWGYIAEI